MEDMNAQDPQTSLETALLSEDEALSERERELARLLEEERAISARLLGEKVRLAAMLEIERTEKRALEVIVETERNVESILRGLDAAKGPRDLFAYVIREIPASFEFGTRLHFVRMEDYLERDTKRRHNVRIGDLSELFRSGLSVYLEQAESENEKRALKRVSVHDGDFTNFRSNREYFPISIRNPIVSGNAIVGYESEALIGYVELPKAKDKRRSIVSPAEQVDKIMRFIQARLERMQSELLLAERTRVSCEDPLTKTYNRRGFFENMELIREKHPDAPFSVIAIDLDRFKSINDTHGHVMGDRALKYAGKVIRERLSGNPGHIIGRVGGEEFVVYLHDQDADVARSIAEDIRTAIAEGAFGGEANLKITASFGVAVSDGKTESIEQAIAKSDKAMYLAKRHGRDRVEMYGPWCEGGAGDEFSIQKPVEQAPARKENRRTGWLDGIRKLFGGKETA